MGPNSIYKLKNGMEYLIPDPKPVVYNGRECVVGLDAKSCGNISMLALDQLKDLAFSIVELDYDIRKWSHLHSKVLVTGLWKIIHQRYSSTKKTIKSSHQASALNAISTQISAGDIIGAYHNLNKIFGKVPAYWGELINIKPAKRKVQSRRVKQNAAKAYRAKIAKKISSASLSPNSTIYKYPVWQPAITIPPDDYFLKNSEPSAKDNALGWLAFSGAENAKGLRFDEWNNLIGRFTTLSFIGRLQTWWGTKGDFTLRTLPLDGNHLAYYLPRAGLRDDAYAPKPPQWPFSYRGRLATEEEKEAIRGAYPPAGGRIGHFIQWYIRKGSIKGCKKHSESFTRHCRDCCQGAYKMWYNAT